MLTKLLSNAIRLVIRVGEATYEVTKIKTWKGCLVIPQKHNEVYVPLKSIVVVTQVKK